MFFVFVLFVFVFVFVFVFEEKVFFVFVFVFVFMEKVFFVFVLFVFSPLSTSRCGLFGCSIGLQIGRERKIKLFSFSALFGGVLLSMVTCQV